MTRKHILVLDVETANDLTDSLVYDIGFLIADLHGNIKERGSYAVKEIFIARPELMNTAYYAEKLPQYYARIANNQQILTDFQTVRNIILGLMRKYSVKEVYAYNAAFDRNALNSTIRYLTQSRSRWFFPYRTQFYCIWAMACDTILQQKTFRRKAETAKWFSPSGKFFSSNAETTYRYMTGEDTFVEAHLGLSDTLIEYEILLHARRQKKKMNRNINPYCFKKMKR